MNASSPAVSGARYDDRPRSVTRPIVTTVILIMLVLMIVRDVLARRPLPEPGTAPPQPMPRD
jgi:hypothetical protein